MPTSGEGREGESSRGVRTHEVRRAVETKQKVTTHRAGWDPGRQRNLSDWFSPEQCSYAYLLADERKTTLAGQTGASGD